MRVCHRFAWCCRQGRDLRPDRGVIRPILPRPIDLNRYTRAPCRSDLVLCRSVSRVPRERSRIAADAIGPFARSAALACCASARMGAHFSDPRQQDPGRGRSQRLNDLLLASLPLFKASKFFLNPEMSLADCALAPLIWRLPVLGVQLPKEAKLIDDYGQRIFRNPGFMRSMTAEEKALRELPA